MAQAERSQQPQSLEELYNQVGPEDAAKLKATATELRRKPKLNLAAILEAHDLLAGKGRDGRFKQWCEWEHINYGYARVMVCAAKKEREIKDEEEVLGNNTSKGKDKEKPPSQNRLLKFPTLCDAEEFDKLVESIIPYGKDTRESAVLAGLRLLAEKPVAQTMAEKVRRTA